jgi:hypothetical protein
MKNLKKFVVNEENENENDLSFIENQKMFSDFIKSIKSGNYSKVLNMLKNPVLDPTQQNNIALKVAEQSGNIDIIELLRNYL